MRRPWTAAAALAVRRAVSAIGFTFVVPSHALFEHLQIDVPIPQQDVPDSSAIFVLCLGHHHDILAKDLLAQGFLGGLPKRLLDLRGINGVEPDLELSL